MSSDSVARATSRELLDAAMQLLSNSVNMAETSAMLDKVRVAQETTAAELLAAHNKAAAELADARLLVLAAVDRLEQIGLRVKERIIELSTAA